MISIQTNVNSLIAQQNLSVNTAFQSKTIQQLTSGYRINQAGDDAAGLAVANKFRSTVAELTQGVANGNDATAQLQIMDGGMTNIGQILDRLKTLATQSASGAFTGNRSTLNSEFQTDLQEIDRQAQSIGLDTGGTFAKSLSVYLGQGSGSGDGAGGASALSNASVVVDLSKATVDSGSLGLKGLKAITGTIDPNGTDIGTGSSNSTTVADIVSAKSGNAEAKAGYATFNFAGPGFSDGSKVSVSVNLSGVSDTGSLVTAINTAIANAGNGSSQADSALKGAGIVATVNTDQYGHQQLAFSSSTTAFQVQAGDQMANALMGNFATPGSATGKAVTSTVTGGTAGVATAAFNPTNVSVQVSGAGLANPVTLQLSSADKAVSDATSDLINQVKQNQQLQDAGISVSLTSDNKLQFSNANGSSFSVSSVGDTANALGLGTFVTNSALNGAASYSDITAGVSYSAAATGNGVATLGFSLNGGATGGITAATVTGNAAATGYTGGGTVGNAAGALGSMTIALNGSTSVNVDFSLDANKSASETVQQAANFINSQIQSQAGYGSDVKLATVDSASNTIKLTGPADGAGTISASGTAAGKLGLTDASGAHTVAASGSAGNTVSVNLAGGDATSAIATGSAAAPTNIATGTSATMALNIDGTTVNANFANDVNAAGAAAALTSTALGVSAASTTDVSALQGTAGTVSTAKLGTLGVNTVVNVQAGNQAAIATVTGTKPATVTDDTHGTVDLTSFAAAKATVTTSLGSVSDPDLSALNLNQFDATAAKAVGGTLGTDANSAIDLSAFKATAATTTSTVSLPTSGLDLSAYKATEASYTGTSVAASGTADMSGSLTGLGNSLSISIADGTVSRSNSINISSAGTLQDVADLVNNDATLNAGGAGTFVHATVVNGALKLDNVSPAMTAGAANTISIVANDASLAVGLSGAGQVTNTTSSGGNATTLNLTVSTLTTTQASITGSAIAGGATYSSALGADMLHITMDNLAAVDVDITGATGTADVMSKIGVALHAVDSNYAVDGSDVASGSGGTLTLHSKVSGTSGQLTVTSTNNLLGLDTASINGTASAGSKNLTLDLNTYTSGSAIAGYINSQARVGLSAGQSIADVAKYNTSTGTITLTANTTGSTSTVNVANNALSNALGLTSGSAANNNTGADATKLKVNIDGLGERDIDISGAATVGQVASAINSFIGSPVASGATGSLTLTSTSTGTASTVKILDNAASQALHLTSGSDSTNSGTAATQLMISVNGGLAQGYSVHNISDLTALAAAITGHGATAAAGDGTDTGGALGSLVIKGTGTGSTNNLTIQDNAVSRLLGLTSGSSVTQAGTDATKLVVQIDGGKAESIDLSGVSSGTPTMSGIATAINAALHTSQAVLDGYSATQNYATANAGGTLTIAGQNLGGGLSITNNGLSKAIGLASGTADTVKSRSQQTLNLQIDGHQQVDIALDSLGTSAKLSDIAAAINSALTSATAQGYGSAYSNVAKANADGTISLTGVTASNTVKVLNSNMSGALQFTTGTSDATGTGAAAQTLNVSIDGKATTQVSFAGITGGGTPTLTDIAAKINATLVADTTNYGAAYANAAKANADGTITISGLAGGSDAGSVTVTNNVAGQTLGLTSGVGASTTVTGKNESLSDVVSFLNTTAQQTLGTSTAAKIVSLDANGSINVSSQTKGANSSVSVVSAGTTAGLANSLNLSGYVDSATTGQSRGLDSVVASLKESFNGNATLQQAGLTAQVNTSTNSLEIKSSNGTQFSLDAWGTKGATTDSDLGFGDSGTAFTNANAVAPQSSSSVLDTQGASAIGTSANGTGNTTSISFQNMQFGNDDQSITISANSPSGVAQTPLTITLQNDSTAQTGANIDSAISTINTKLQQSNNATLRSITAVQETGADGKESINFISSLSSFNVSVSSSAGAAVGDGLNGGQAKTFSSAMNGASSSIAIDTQAGAQQAVTALGAAIATLGSAQATIGRGENQLTYAISLATSQITNFSAAESAIRDTNVAQQAANLSKAQTLSQAAIAAMAQANSAPQAVLSLLRG